MRVLNVLEHICRHHEKIIISVQNVVLFDWTVITLSST